MVESSLAPFFIFDLAFLLEAIVYLYVVCLQFTLYLSVHCCAQLACKAAFASCTGLLKSEEGSLTSHAAKW